MGLLLVSNKIYAIKLRMLMQYLLEIHVSYVLLSCTVFLLSLTVRNLATVGC